MINDIDAVLETISVYISQIDFTSYAVRNEDNEMLFMGECDEAHAYFESLLTAEQIEALTLAQEIDHQLMLEEQSNRQLGYTN